MTYRYIDEIKHLIEMIEEKDNESIEQAIELLTDTIANKRSIYIFGASHAGILSQESFYRAGGLMPITPIFAKETMVDREPITFTSKMERCLGYGTLVASTYPFKENDVLIVNSVSGRNPVTIEIAISAKKAGMKVIGITNLTYSKSVTSRHPDGKNLFEYCDIVLDNHGEIGDACVPIKNTSQKCAPTSTVVGSILLNTIYSETVNRLVDIGISTPPVFYSANVDGGDEKNKQLFEQYKDVIHYKF